MVDDDDEDEGPLPPPGPGTLSPHARQPKVRTGPLYVTLTGANRLKAELQLLLNVERPKVTSEVSVAAAHGDRSENAEYIYGKKRLREIDRRLGFLKKRLEISTVVDPRDNQDPSRIFFGATVTLENEDDGTVTTYQIVGPDETDTKGGKISVESPIGRALIGRRKGETVEVKRPKGEVELTVVAIKYV